MKIETPPVLKGTSDERVWNALTGWLSMLHSQIGKAFSHGFTTVTKTTTATLRIEEMGFVLVDSSGGTFSITLPPAARIGAGGWYWFIKTDSSVNAVTLDGSGSETINGAATVNFLDAQYDFCVLLSSGSGWFIVNRRSTAEI